MIDCAGNVVLMLLTVPPEAGGMTVKSDCATIPAKLALLYKNAFVVPVDSTLARRTSH